MNKHYLPSAPLVPSLFVLEVREEALQLFFSDIKEKTHLVQPKLSGFVVFLARA